MNSDNLANFLIVAARSDHPFAAAVLTSTGNKTVSAKLLGVKIEEGGKFKIEFDRTSEKRVQCSITKVDDGSLAGRSNSDNEDDALLYAVYRAIC